MLITSVVIDGVDVVALTVSTKSYITSSSLRFFLLALVTAAGADDDGKDDTDDDCDDCDDMDDVGVSSVDCHSSSRLSSVCVVSTCTPNVFTDAAFNIISCMSFARFTWDNILGLPVAFFSSYSFLNFICNEARVRGTDSYVGVYMNTCRQHVLKVPRPPTHPAADANEAPCRAPAEAAQFLQETWPDVHFSTCF